jgi:hypothetical protein
MKHRVRTVFRSRFETHWKPARTDTPSLPALVPPPHFLLISYTCTSASVPGLKLELEAPIRHPFFPALPEGKNNGRACPCSYSPTRTRLDVCSDRDQTFELPLEVPLSSPDAPRRSPHPAYDSLVLTLYPLPTPCTDRLTLESHARTRADTPSLRTYTHNAAGACYEARSFSPPGLVFCYPPSMCPFLRSTSPNRMSPFPHPQIPTFAPAVCECRQKCPLACSDVLYYTCFSNVHIVSPNLPFYILHLTVSSIIAFRLILVLHGGYM